MYCPASDKEHYIKVDTKQLKELYQKLGPMNFPQKVILIDFIGLAILWFVSLVFTNVIHSFVIPNRLSRKGIADLSIPGWQQLFPWPSNYISDGTVSMGEVPWIINICWSCILTFFWSAAAAVLFFIPSRVERSRNVLDWQECHKLPWYSSHFTRRYLLIWPDWITILLGMLSFW